MTTNAMIVLQDCEEALEELRAGPIGSLWRRRWAGQVALLRSVMHVLQKVDGAAGSAYRSAIAEAWVSLNRTKPDPYIFWSFIEAERNSIVKTYQTVAQQNVTIRVAWPDEPPLGARTGVRRPGHATRAEYTYTMGDGPFKGRDPRDIAAEAIEWLRFYLAGVDARASELANGQV